MGKIITPAKAKLISGILARDDKVLKKTKDILCNEFGNSDSESEVIPFNFTEYYNKEMGQEIVRQYISFETLIDQENIEVIKNKTNNLEQIFMIGSNRQANMDPGYITLDKMVLATTKPATYRIYLGNGIYAQSTLFFRDGSYHPWEWTYPDYRHPGTISFFNNVRKIYKNQIKEDS